MTKNKNVYKHQAQLNNHFSQQKLINNSQALYKKAYQNDLRLANFLVEKFFFLLKGSKDEVFPVDQRKGIFGILRGKAKK